jgi:hypothetical protein
MNACLLRLWVLISTGIVFLVAAFFYGFVGLPLGVPQGVLILLKFAAPFAALGLILWVFRRLHGDDEATPAAVKGDDMLMDELSRLRRLREEAIITEDEFRFRMKGFFP